MPHDPEPQAEPARPGPDSRLTRLYAGALLVELLVLLGLWALGAWSG